MLCGSGIDLDIVEIVQHLLSYNVEGTRKFVMGGRSWKFGPTVFNMYK